MSVVVRRLLSLPRFGARRVSDLLLGEPARASLAWSDFEHLGDLRDLAARIVAAAGNLEAGRGAARTFSSMARRERARASSPRRSAPTSASRSSFAERRTTRTPSPTARADRGAADRQRDRRRGAKDDHRRRRGGRPVRRLRRGRRLEPTRQQGVHEPAARASGRSDDLDRQRRRSARSRDHPAHEPRAALSQAYPLCAQGAMVARIAKSVRFPLDESAALELARTPRTACAHRECDPLRDA